MERVTEGVESGWFRSRLDDIEGTRHTIHRSTVTPFARHHMDSILAVMLQAGHSYLHGYHLTHSPVRWPVNSTSMPRGTGCLIGGGFKCMCECVCFPYLPAQLSALSNAGGPNRVSLGLQTARRVDNPLPSQLAQLASCGGARGTSGIQPKMTKRFACNSWTKVGLHNRQSMH